LQGLTQVVGLCNDAERADGDALIGDPTETALLEYAEQGGLQSWPREAEVPFDSERMRMTTVNRSPDGTLWALVKGAPEQVLPRCDCCDGAESTAHEMAAAGLRVLAAARRPLGEIPHDVADVEDGLELVGLVGLLDPPRPTASDAVSQCKSAGIVAVMITGDHPATAAAVAARVGIAVTPDKVMTGVELEQSSDDDLRTRVEDVRVYARVDPAQKIRLVRALQSRTQVASMTGDGVNDAPALKQADVGVAMGEGGTDVARGAADLILLDNNFATIVAAVREGRRIYDNIRRFVRYALTCNAGEIWTIFLAPFLGLPLPLLPLQILWINLVTDGLPGLALVREQAEPDVMQRPPRPPRQSIFADGMAVDIVWVGLLIGGLSLGAMSIGYFGGSESWQSMVFTTLVLAQLVNAFVVRSERRSVFQMGWFSNPLLLWTLIATFTAHMAVVYWAPLQSVFRTSAMTWQELAVCILLSLVVLVAVETAKFIRRRSSSRRRTASTRAGATAGG
jgi:Ca2+-transporting ATPase